MIHFSRLRTAPRFTLEHAAPQASTDFAEHLTSVLSDKTYWSSHKRQVRASLLAVTFSMAWAGVSLTLLLTADLRPPADAFWLLCLVLAAGLFCVAQFTLLGSLASHSAMQRFAFGQKDLEVFEAVRDYETLRESINALNELVKLTGGSKTAEVALVASSVAFISLASAQEADDDTDKRRNQILMGWRKRGADDALLAKLAMQGSVHS